MKRIVAAVACLAIAACSAPNTPTDGAWVGTITADGDTTTVVNESGSVWGGTARLVEEASIGVDIGAEEYMLGQITALYATDDEIYIVDQSASKVRVYDFAGNHLRSFGRSGQGPGELSSFTNDVAVRGDRVYVGDFNNRRINIYSRDGEPIDEIPLSTEVACCRLRLVFAEADGVWLQVRVAGNDADPSRDGIRVYATDGPVGEVVLVPEVKYDRRTVRLSGREIESVPFAAAAVWTLGYDQSLVVGATDRYAFQLIRTDGTIVQVERFWEPVRVTSSEADYWRRFTIANLSWATELDWNGENIPGHKPAYLALLPAASGELWVIRQGHGPTEACDVEPDALAAESDPALVRDCLFGDLLTDVFDGDGRYLGDVEGLPFFFSNPFIDGSTVVAQQQDDVGTITIKRYRLELPGEAGG